MTRINGPSRYLADVVGPAEECYGIFVHGLGDDALLLYRAVGSTWAKVKR